MGLSQVIQAATKTAFKAIGDLGQTCTYTSMPTVTYDPATGTNTPSAYNAETGTYSAWGTDYPGLSILFESYSAREVQESGGTIISSDQKASIPSLNLTPGPKVTDTITDPDSIVWTVENMALDSARALWVYQVRKGL